jgi:hypothetical protein
MELIEIKKNLFITPEEYYLAHCISADANRGGYMRSSFYFFTEPLGSITSWIDVSP